MTRTKYVKLRVEDYEFMKSLLYLCHGLMETIAHSELTVREAEKMLAQLQGTERFYFEAEKRELA